MQERLADNINNAFEDASIRKPSNSETLAQETLQCSNPGSERLA